MSLITVAEMASYLECETDDAFMLLIQDPTEDWFDQQVNRALGETDYTLERYDGTGDSWLELRNYPVTAVTRLSMGVRDGLWVKNGNTDLTLASASITGSNLVLTSSGGADPHSATIAIGAETLATLAALVIAEGHGWTAGVSDSANDDILATEMFDRLGGNANNNKCEFDMPDSPSEEKFEIDGEGSIKLRDGVFCMGTNNISVTYKAGYTTTTVPGYLKLAILKMTKVFYEMVDQNMENFKSFKAGDVSRVLKDDQVPKFVQGVIAMMRRQSL